ncbi:peptide deformylase [Eubacterium maltosivorans]|uniref:Peptide deformylase n=1 Tax=Eubacterium maltosivorans TaxID=2041044 RepID=A0A4P9C7U0_EUBML|nr:peptide deformylase [Eubacterium maltosivorans]QCT71464.1 peptide deformylase [Eubacterium maltosivorans]
MAIRQIRKLPDDILHKKCRLVETIDERTLELIKDMTETMYQLPNCGGLAANQVGVLKRVVVIDVGEGLYQLVNPKIIEAEGERVVVEGCMSSPDVWGKVKRPERVVVEYTTPEGEVLQKEAEGLLAKCFCHELDHLDGIFFTDKVIEYVDL